jgi:hypothetical protein
MAAAAFLRLRVCVARSGAGESSATAVAAERKFCVEVAPSSTVAELVAAAEAAHARICEGGGRVASAWLAARAHAAPLRPLPPAVESELPLRVGLVMDADGFCLQREFAVGDYARDGDCLTVVAASLQWPEQLDGRGGGIGSGNEATAASPPRFPASSPEAALAFWADVTSHATRCVERFVLARTAPAARLAECGAVEMLVAAVLRGGDDAERAARSLEAVALELAREETRLQSASRLAFLAARLAPELRSDVQPTTLAALLSAVASAMRAQDAGAREGLSRKLALETRVLAIAQSLGEAANEALVTQLADLAALVAADDAAIGDVRGEGAVASLLLSSRPALAGVGLAALAHRVQHDAAVRRKLFAGLFGVGGDLSEIGRALMSFAFGSHGGAAPASAAFPTRLAPPALRVLEAFASDGELHRGLQRLRVPALLKQTALLELDGGEGDQPLHAPARQLLQVTRAAAGAALSTFLWSGGDRLVAISHDSVLELVASGHESLQLYLARRLDPSASWPCQSSLDERVTELAALLGPPAARKGAAAAPPRSPAVRAEALNSLARMALAPELRPALAQSHLLTCLAALVGGAGDTPAEVSRLAAKVLANLAVGDAHAHAQVCRLLRVGASATAPPDPLVGVYLGVILSAAGGRA